MNVIRKLMILLVALAAVVVVSASDNQVFGSTSTAKLPSWLTVHKNRDTMSKYMELARQRHAESIQKAKDNYFHGACTSSPTGTATTILDDYQIQAAGSLPDFETELERRLFVTSSQTPLFTKEECQECVAHAESHFSGKDWTTLPSGQYDVAGFWIRDIPAVHDWFNQMVRERLFPLLVQQFPHFVDSPEDLVVDNAYLFKYTPETGRRTDVHTDSGCLSFTIALNSDQEYSGGGTWFEGLIGSKSVIEMNVGECTVRPGGVRHCGHAVTSGTRYIIGGFCMNTKKVEYVRMLLGLGSEEAGKKNYKKAQEALEVAIALNPNFDGPYSHLADLLQKQGKTKEAKQVLEHCFHHINPQCGEVAYSLGVIYLDEEDYDNAKKCMDVCLESDDCDVDAMMVLAQACQGKQDSAGEEAWYQRIVTTPGASSKVIGKAYCNLGVLHEGTDQEIDYYQKSLEFVSDFTPNFNLGVAYASRKDYDPAVSSFRRAIETTEEKSDEQSQALQYLYRVTMGKLQKENPSGPSSREEMMKLFVEIMGEQNYQRMAALRP